MKTYHVDFFVNGEEYELDVPANKTALNVIRDMLDLTGAKEGCGAGECGACAMIVDGVLINGCLMLAPEMDGKHFETVEGFADEKGNLSPIQQSFIDHAALQCGYCTPGFIVSATALLRENPHPTRDEIVHYMSGNLCRCTGYENIFKAVKKTMLRRLGRLDDPFLNT